jgi:hypothetical protein
MIARCITTRAADLGPYSGGLYYTDATRFGALRINQLYVVFGMSLFRPSRLAADSPRKPDWFPAAAGLSVLVCHESDRPPTVRPDWYPIELFAIEDPRIPASWEFSPVRRGAEASETDILARWGYPLLVHSDEHFDGLVERDPKALAEFRREYDRNAATLSADA